MVLGFERNEEAAVILLGARWSAGRP